MTGWIPPRDSHRDGLYLTVPGDDAAGALSGLGIPLAQRPLEDVYVVGWARRASDGVVGRARLDAETGIKHVVARLASKSRRGPARRPSSVVATVADTLRRAACRWCPYADVARIEAVERARAKELGVEEFCVRQQPPDAPRSSAASRAPALPARPR